MQTCRRLVLAVTVTGRVGVVLLTLAVSGCGEATSPKAQVKGKVTLNGEPVKGGTILVAPLTSSGEAASGRSSVRWDVHAEHAAAR